MNEVILPTGWATATINDLIGKHGVFRDGDWVESKDQDKNGQVRLVQLADIGDGEFRDKSSRFLTSEKAIELNCTFLKTGDILVARMPDPLGRACLFPLHGDKKFVTVVDVCVIRFGNDYVNAKYLIHALNSPASRRKISDHQTGSTRKRISRGNLSTVQFPIAPFNEQHRIVAKIEELFSELDKGIENLKTARTQLKMYRQALLKHAFAGKGLAQKGIIAKPFGEEYFLTLGDVIQTLGQGWSPRCLETPSKSDDVWGVIRTTAIQPLHFDDTKNKQLPIGLTPRPHLEIIPGDVLITRAGPRTRVGIACFVKNTRPKLMVCDKAYRLRVHKERILPQYLVMLLNTSEVLSELEKLKSGISDSGLNLTQDKFLTLKITVPSLEHQQMILDDIEEKLTNVAFLETQIDDSLQQAEALRQSILKKAFSGQLVPQDPHDEPASALLARIKAERADTALKTKRKTT